jgi:hypothetical protein
MYGGSTTKYITSSPVRPRSDGHHLARPRIVKTMKYYFLWVSFIAAFMYNAFYLFPGIKSRSFARETPYSCLVSSNHAKPNLVVVPSVFHEYDNLMPHWVGHSFSTYVYQRLNPKLPCFSPNMGFEAGVHIHYIVDNYDKLPAMVVFAQDTGSHQPHFEHYVNCLKPTVPFVHLNSYWISGRGTVNKNDDCWRKMAAIFNKTLPDPLRMSGYCCSQWAASREQLRRTSLRTYRHLLSFIRDPQSCPTHNKPMNKEVAGTYEHLLHFLIGGQPVDMIRYSQKELCESFQEGCLGSPCKPTYTLIHPTKTGGTAFADHAKKYYTTRIQWSVHSKTTREAKHPIVFVRDPYSRMESMYFYWKYGSKRHPLSSRTINALEEYTFSDFVGFVWHKNPILVHTHTSFQHYQPIIDWISPLDYHKSIVVVYNTENFSGCIRQLETLLGISTSKPLSRINVSNKPPKDHGLLSCVSCNKTIKSLFGGDFELMKVIAQSPDMFRAVITCEGSRRS